MNSWGQPPAVKKPRRWLSCLVGCLIAVGVVILFFLIIALLRAHAPVREEAFFTPVVSGFARVQLDALKSQAVKELLRAAIKNESKSNTNTNEPDPEQILSYLGLILHENHFFYIYPNEQEKTSDFMAVINIKRLLWLVSAMLTDDTNKTIQKISPPANIKARCFMINKSENEVKAEKDDNTPKGPFFVAVTPRAVIFSNSQLRMNDGLTQLFAPKTNEDLAPLARSLLPLPSADDFINGFALWQKKWNANYVKDMKEKYPDAASDFDVVGLALDQTQFKGITFKCKLVSSDVFNFTLEILCSSEQEAAAVAEILNQKVKPHVDKDSREIEFTADKDKINAIIEISGIEQKFLEGMKEK